MDLVSTVKLRAIAAQLERQALELRRLADLRDGAARVVKKAARRARTSTVKKKRVQKRKTPPKAARKTGAARAR